MPTMPMKPTMMPTAMPGDASQEYKANPFDQQKQDAESNDPKVLLSKIVDLVTQLQSVLEEEESSEGGAEFEPQSNEEVAAGIPPVPKKPKATFNAGFTGGKAG